MEWLPLQSTHPASWTPAPSPSPSPAPLSCSFIILIYSFFEEPQKFAQPKQRLQICAQLHFGSSLICEIASNFRKLLTLRKWRGETQPYCPVLGELLLIVPFSIAACHQGARILRIRSGGPCQTYCREPGAVNTLANCSTQYN